MQGEQQQTDIDGVGTPAKQQMPHHQQRKVVLCGLGRFGLRIVELLREEGAEVVVISNEGTRADRLRMAREMGAALIEGDFRFARERAAAGVAEAYSVILATSDEEANLETALDVRQENPTAHIVMRLDSHKLGARLERDFGIDAVLSPPVIAARSFSVAALQPLPPQAEMCAAGAEQNTEAATQAAAAAAAAAKQQHERDVMAGRRIPGLPVSAAATKAASRMGLRRRFALPPRREPIALASALGLLFIAAVFVFHRFLNLSLVDAVYFTATILSTVGFGDFALRDQAPAIKLFGAVLMFGGVTLIAVLSSYLTHFFLSGAAMQMRAERAARRMRDHVIVCGLGSVGFEVVQDLLERNIPVVVIDATPDDLNFQNLSAQVPLLIGDATQPNVLLRAGIDRARAVVAAISNDALNLEIGLGVQSLVEERRPSRPLRIVMRCFDPDLAARIHACSDAYTLLSSAEIAAPIFVSSALMPPSPVPVAATA